MASNAAKLLKVAANGQISIGKEWAGRQILIEKVNESELRIVSGAFVPDHQATFYTEKAKNALQDFEKWAPNHPPKKSNTKALFDRLEKKAREKAK